MKGKSQHLNNPTDQPNGIFENVEQGFHVNISETRKLTYLKVQDGKFEFELEKFILRKFWNEVSIFSCSL